MPKISTRYTWGQRLQTQLVWVPGCLAALYFMGLALAALFGYSLNGQTYYAFELANKLPWPTSQEAAGLLTVARNFVAMFLLLLPACGVLLVSSILDRLINRIREGVEARGDA